MPIVLYLTGFLLALEYRRFRRRELDQVPAQGFGDGNNHAAVRTVFPQALKQVGYLCKVRLRVPRVEDGETLIVEEPA